MMQSAIVGSWYNTGFYGHYRGQFKCELSQEYRLAAKPQPPALFLQRIKEPPKQHLFSKHDNRTTFEPGIGKRKAWEKLKKRCNVFNWPYDGTLSPLVSSYQKDYMEGPFLQPLVHYIQYGASQCLDLKRIPSTTYQHTFCHQPVSQIPDEKLQKEVYEPKEKAGISPSPALSALPKCLPDLVTVNRKKSEHFLPLTVSDCLCWLDPLKKAA